MHQILGGALLLFRGVKVTCNPSPNCSRHFDMNFSVTQIRENYCIKVKTPSGYCNTFWCSATSGNRMQCFRRSSICFRYLLRFVVVVVFALPVYYSRKCLNRFHKIRIKLIKSGLLKTISSVVLRQFADDLLCSSAWNYEILGAHFMLTFLTLLFMFDFISAD